MPLTGTYSRTLDDKKRVAVPKRLRDDFGEGELQCLYIAPGTTRSLELYSPQGFDRLAGRLAAQSPQRADVRDYVRLFYAAAERLDLDGQGRVRIPERLLPHAGLDREIVLLGVHDHIEIWDTKLWNEFLSQRTPEFDKLAAQAFQ